MIIIIIIIIPFFCFFSRFGLGCSKMGVMSYIADPPLIYIRNRIVSQRSTMRSIS